MNEKKENKNDVQEAADDRKLIGYFTSFEEGEPQTPVPVYVNKDGELPPGWIWVRVSGVIEADGRLRLYDRKPRFEAVEIEDALKPENSSKPE